MTGLVWRPVRRRAQQYGGRVVRATYRVQEGEEGWGGGGDGGSTTIPWTSFLEVAKGCLAVPVDVTDDSEKLKHLLVTATKCGTGEGSVAVVKCAVFRLVDDVDACLDHDIYQRGHELTRHLITDCPLEDTRARRVIAVSVTQSRSVSSGEHSADFVPLTGIDSVE